VADQSPTLDSRKGVWVFQGIISGGGSLSDWQRIERSTLRSLSAGFCVLPKKFSLFPADVVAPNGGLLGALDGVRN